MCQTQEIDYNGLVKAGRQVGDILMSNNELRKQTRGQQELTGNTVVPDMQGNKCCMSFDPQQAELCVKAEHNQKHLLL